MSRLSAAWNRISVGLIGLVLLLVGLSGIVTQTGLSPFAGWIEQVDSTRFSSAADADWWTWVLVGVVAIALIWGIRLLVTLVRPQAVGQLILDGSLEGGTMTIAPSVIASAVQAELSADPLFDSVSVKGLGDRGASILRIVVTVPPTRSYAEVLAAVRPAVQHVRAAVDGSGLQVQVMVQLVAEKART